MINDVRRAYFYAACKRVLYVELPADPMAGRGMLGRLNLSMYGTRDAASNWQETIRDHLANIGFRRGAGHPSVVHHETRDVTTLVHGDDYTTSGDSVDLDWFDG